MCQRGCVQGISSPKLSEKIQLNVSYDHSSITEHYIIWLHKIKHTHTLKQTYTATGDLWMYSRPELNDFDLSPPLSLSPSLFFHVSLSHLFMSNIRPVHTADLFRHTCVSLATLHYKREGRPLGDKGSGTDRVCNMVGCDITAFTIDFFSLPLNPLF